MFALLLSVGFALCPSNSKDGLESIPIVAGPLRGCKDRGARTGHLCAWWGPFPLVPLVMFSTDSLEDRWGLEHSLVIPGGSIHALLSNFLSAHSDFSVSVKPKLLLEEALLGCFLELPLNYLILVTI